MSKKKQTRGRSRALSHVPASGGVEARAAQAAAEGRAARSSEEAHHDTLPPSSRDASTRQADAEGLDALAGRLMLDDAKTTWPTSSSPRSPTRATPPRARRRHGCRRRSRAASASSKSASTG